MSHKQIFELIMLLNNFVGITVVIRFYNGFLEKKDKTRLKQGIMFMVIIFFSTSLNIITQHVNISVILAYLIYLTIAMIYFQGNIHIKMVACTFFVIFSMVTELLTAFLLISVFDMGIQGLRDNLLSLLLGGVVSKLLLMLIIEIIIRILSLKASRVSISSWILIITIPVISIYISIISVYKSVLLNQFSMEALLLCLTMLYINLITLYLFDNIITQIDKNNQMRLREEQLLIQQKQYQNIITGYEQVKKIRHDMLNHLTSLRGYLDDAKYQEAQIYIGRLRGDLVSSVKEIISGNIVIDALINNRKKEAANNDIIFNIDIIVPCELNIDDIDLCIILGNALDNACEACHRITEENDKKEINLIMKYKNSKLLIDLRNSYNELTIKCIDGQYVSSKDYRMKNSYGIGFNNMTSVINKYGGTLKSEINKDYFELKILVPDKKISEM